MASTNVLFICSKNRWRSPTAERLYRRDPRFNVRSAGTARSATRSVTADDITWADVIVVMEDKHRRRLRGDHRRLLDYTPIHVLDIPDDYPFMDPELIEAIENGVESLFADPEVQP